MGSFGRVPRVDEVAVQARQRLAFDADRVVAVGFDVPGSGPAFAKGDFAPGVVVEVALAVPIRGDAVEAHDVAAGVGPRLGGVGVAALAGVVVDQDGFLVVGADKGHAAGFGEAGHAGQVLVFEGRDVGRPGLAKPHLHARQAAAQGGAPPGLGVGGARLFLGGFAHRAPGARRAQMHGGGGRFLGPGQRHVGCIAGALVDEVVLDHLQRLQQVASLVVRKEGKLRGFLRRFERDPQLVDDLVQDVYLEVLKSLCNFGGRSCLESWIFGVAQNVGRQHVARAVAHRERFVDMEDGPADTRGAPDVFHTVALQQRLRLVDQKMRAMPEALSSTFEAYIEDGLTYEQAAKSLRIPIGTVRSRISRVRELVQDC